jgi:hypothetical protein
MEGGGDGVSGMLLVARAEAALSAQLDVTAELRSQLHTARERAEVAEAQCAAMREALFAIAGNAHVMTTIYDTLGPPYYSIGLALATDAGAKMLAEVKRLREFVAAWKAVQDYEVGELDAIEPLHPFTPEWEAVVRDYGERFPAVYGRWQHAIKAVLPGYERCSCPTCRPDLAALDATEPSP